jgi:hypothetical protein
MPMKLISKKKRGGAGENSLAGNTTFDTIKRTTEAELQGKSWADLASEATTPRTSMSSVDNVSNAFYKKVEKALAEYGVNSNEEFDKIKKITEAELQGKRWADLVSAATTPRTSMSGDNASRVNSSSSKLSEEYIDKIKDIIKQSSSTNITDADINSALSTAYNETVKYANFVSTNTNAGLKTTNGSKNAPIIFGQGFPPSVLNTYNSAVPNTNTNAGLKTTNGSKNAPIIFGQGFPPNVLNTYNNVVSTTKANGTTSVPAITNANGTNNIVLRTSPSWTDKQYNFGNYVLNTRASETGSSPDVNDMFKDLNIEAIKRNLRTVKLSANTTVGKFFPEPSPNSSPYIFDVKINNNEFNEVKNNIKAILQSVRQTYTELMNQIIDNNSKNVETMKTELENIISAITTVVIILSRVYVCVVVSEYLQTKSPSSQSKVEDKKKKIDKLKTLLKDTIPLLLKLENQNNNISI